MKKLFSEINRGEVFRVETPKIDDDDKVTYIHCVCLSDGNILNLNVMRIAHKTFAFQHNQKVETIGKFEWEAIEEETGLVNASSTSETKSVFGKTSDHDNTDKKI